MAVRTKSSFPRLDHVLVRGGTVVTMDPKLRVVRGDVCVENHRITHVGKGSPPVSQVLDARGCAVIPGLVQAHVHLCQTLLRGMADDLPLLEWLKKCIWPLEAAHDARSLRASAELGLAEMIRAGTTTILDMGTVHEQDVIFEAMAKSGIRGQSGKAMMDRGQGVPKGLRERTRDSLDESERLAKRWHGAEKGRLGYAFAPRFILSCSDALLRGAAGLSEDYDTLIHTHAAEHADERRAVKKALGKDDVRALSEAGIEGPRAVLAHGVQLRPAEMRAMARRGTRVVHCPSANLKLGSGIAKVAAMREAGLVVGLGADGAPCNNRMDPWTEIREAALLGKIAAGDPAAMTARDALSLATIDGARVLGLDAEIGSIEVGKRADLTVVRLDRLHTEPAGDPIAQLVYAATAADVVHVVVNGHILVQDGQLQTLDEERVLANARREAKKLQARL